MYSNFIKLTTVINGRNMLVNWTTISTLEDLGDQRRIVALTGGVHYVKESIKQIEKLISKTKYPTLTTHNETNIFNKYSRTPNSFKL